MESHGLTYDEYIANFTGNATYYVFFHGVFVYEYNSDGVQLAYGKSSTMNPNTLTDPWNHPINPNNLPIYQHTITTTTGRTYTFELTLVDFGDNIFNAKGNLVDFN